MDILLRQTQKDVEKIKKQRFFWKHNLKVSNTFVNSDNINQTIKKMKVPKKIGLLSIDVDSIDYWILCKISETLPGIIVCEFNPLFGTKKAITVPDKKTLFETKSILVIYILVPQLKHSVNYYQKKIMCF